MAFSLLYENFYTYELLTNLDVVITDIVKAKIEANVLKMPKL